MFLFKSRKLRKECLEEILVQAKNAGIEFHESEIQISSRKRNSHRGKINNEARKELEEVKKLGKSYELEFWIDDRLVAEVGGIQSNLYKSAVPIPEGFINKIGIKYYSPNYDKLRKEFERVRNKNKEIFDGIAVELGHWVVRRPQKIYDYPSRIPDEFDHFYGSINGVETILVKGPNDEIWLKKQSDWKDILLRHEGDIELWDGKSQDFWEKMAKEGFQCSTCDGYGKELVGHYDDDNYETCSKCDGEKTVYVSADETKIKVKPEEIKYWFVEKHKSATLDEMKRRGIVIEPEYRPMANSDVYMRINVLN